MSKKFTEATPREWAASVLDDWCKAQEDALEGASREDMEGIIEGIKTSRYLSLKLKSTESSHNTSSAEWLCILLYLQQELAD